MSFLSTEQQKINLKTLWFYENGSHSIASRFIAMLEDLPNLCCNEIKKLIRGTTTENVAISILIV